MAGHDREELDLSHNEGSSTLAMVPIRADREEGVPMKSSTGHGGSLQPVDDMEEMVTDGARTTTVNLEAMLWPCIVHSTMAKCNGLLDGTHDTWWATKLRS